MINSQGKQVSQKHIDAIALEHQYLQDLESILDKRDNEHKGIWTLELLKEYRQVLIKFNVINT